MNQSEEDDATNSLSDSLGSVSTLEYNGTVYMDIDAITATNSGIALALDERIHPMMKDLPTEFLSGVVFTLNMYRRIHSGILSRHAADIVPDHIPDGMDDVVD